MRRVAILAALSLLAGCHKHNEARVQPKAPQAPPIALDPNPPMKSSDIDAIAAEIKARHPRAGTPGGSSATPVPNATPVHK